MKMIYQDDIRGIEAVMLPEDYDGKGSVTIVKQQKHDLEGVDGIVVHTVNIDLETLTLICNKAKVMKSMITSKNEPKKPELYMKPKPLMPSSEFKPKNVMK